MLEAIENGRWTLDAFLEPLQSGELYRCSDTENRRPLLAKVIPHSENTDITETLPAINRSNPERKTFYIAKLEHIYRDDTRTILFYDSPSESTLKSELEYRMPALAEGVLLLSQVANGIEELHAENIIHGRLSTESIFLNSENSVRLSEFNLSFLWKQADTSGLAYLDPILPSIGIRTERSDLYALGILTYQLATGTLPFEISSIEDLKNRPSNPPPPMGKRASAWPPEAFALAQQCVSLNPEERITSIGEAITTINALARQCNAAPAPRSHRPKKADESNEPRKMTVFLSEPPPQESALASVPAWARWTLFVALLVAVLYTSNLPLEWIGLSETSTKELNTNEPNAPHSLHDINLGFYRGKSRNLNDLDKLLDLLIEKRVESLLISIGECAGVPVDLDTGHFSCNGDALLTIRQIRDKYLEGTITQRGRKIPWKAERSL